MVGATSTVAIAEQEGGRRPDRPGRATPDQGVRPGYHGGAGHRKAVQREVTGPRERNRAPGLVRQQNPCPSPGATRRRKRRGRHRRPPRSDRLRRYRRRGGPSAWMVDRRVTRTVWSCPDHAWMGRLLQGRRSRQQDNSRFLMPTGGTSCSPPFFPTSQQRLTTASS